MFEQIRTERDILLIDASNEFMKTNSLDLTLSMALGITEIFMAG